MLGGRRCPGRSFPKDPLLFHVCVSCALPPTSLEDLWPAEMSFVWVYFHPRARCPLGSLSLKPGPLTLGHVGRVPFSGCCCRMLGCSVASTMRVSEAGDWALCVSVPVFSPARCLSLASGPALPVCREEAACMPDTHRGDSCLGFCQG